MTETERLLVLSDLPVRTVAMLLAASVLAACPYGAGNPNVAGDPPSVNKATASPLKDVPLCPGGDRAQACLLGKSCRITDKGCQVCQRRHHIHKLHTSFCPWFVTNAKRSRSN